MIRPLPYAEHLHPQVSEFLADQPKKLLIAGQWAPAASGWTFTKEVVSAIKMFRYYAGWPTKIEGDVKPVSTRCG